MTFPHPPPEAREALAALIALDPSLARIEAAAGPLPWRRRPAGFIGLLQGIVGQQISNQAAAAIWTRLTAQPGATTPDGLMALSDEALRVAGLSRPKIRHARSLAGAIVEGRLVPDALVGMSDHEAIAAISAVPGLGPWTAEVYLLFCLGRTDVFPAGDIALAGALADLRGLAVRPAPAALRTLVQIWCPWRSLAARLLWHHWRHLTGRPAFDESAPVGSNQIFTPGRQANS